jgi:GT2 family glycosyltransferase
MSANDANHPPVPASAPVVTVVIVSYNTRDLLRDCLASLPAAAGPRTFETVVVDNRSRDGSAEMVEREFPSVRVIRPDRNLGFAAANNRGFAVARGRYLYCLNPDTRSHAGSLDALVRVLEEEPEVGYVGPRLLNADGTHQLSAYRFHTALTPFVSWSMLGLDRRFPYSRHATSMHHAYGRDEPFAAEWLLGAAILVRRDAVEAAGGFDESYFLYAEEIEWCHRLSRAGWRGRYAPEATVTHIRSASTSHLDDAHAFKGHDPRLLVHAHRKLARQTLGPLGPVAYTSMHVLGMSLALGRNLPGMPRRDAAKARAARLWIRYLLFPGRKPSR